MKSMVMIVSWAALGSFLGAQKTTRESVGSSGVQGSVSSKNADLSGDGRFVAFASEAPEFGCSNGAIQIYLRDRYSGTTELISRDANGLCGDGDSEFPRLSNDGRFVTFTTKATNLVTPDLNSVIADSLLFDCQTGVTVRANVDETGVQGSTAALGPDISGDGRYVAFTTSAQLAASDTNFANDIYVFDRITQAPLLVSIANDGGIGDARSIQPSISGDGLRIAFTSFATNLVAGDTNDQADLFLRDRLLATTFRVLGNGGVQPNGISDMSSISDDGLRVAYVSAANNLVPGDTNGQPDVFVFDGPLLTNIRASVYSNGNQAIGGSTQPDLAGDGFSVAFQCSDDLTSEGVSQNTDHTFLRRLAAASTLLVSTSATELFSASSGVFPATNADGRYVVFEGSDNLSAADTNGVGDVYLRDLNEAPVSFCTAKINSLGCVPIVQASGAASLAGSQTLDVFCFNVLNNKNGLFFYSSNGPGALPFFGGTLCVTPPLRRTPIQNSLGNSPPNDCSGTLNFEFSAWIQAGSDPFVQIGSTIAGQFWTRDPQSSDGVGLSDAVYFVVCP